MSKDQAIGLIILIVSIAVIIIYGWLVFRPPTVYVLGVPIDIFVLKLTGFIAVAGIFGIVAWIGYTLATTPPPKPIEELEKELEKELKELEKEVKEEKTETTEKTESS